MNKIRREALREVIELIESAQHDLERHLADEEEYRDNIPENLQGSERYEKADMACDELDNARESLDEALESLYSAIE